jgi:hypothetical protein
MEKLTFIGSSSKYSIWLGLEGRLMKDELERL